MDYAHLISKAIEAREKAYAPYSDFKVGAALLTRRGKIFTGCNVENASYGLTICAERTAVVKAISAGEDDFIAIAIVADKERPCNPCGACRQVLAEFAPDMEVILANLKGDRVIINLSELLPEAFTFIEK